MFSKLSAVLAAAVAAVALVACSGTPVAPSATSDDIAGKAIVVLSVSHDVGAGDGANAIFYMDSGPLKEGTHLMSMKDVLSVPVKSDFQDRRGHLYVLEVESGTHHIDSWQVASGGMRIKPSVQPQPLSFTVGKGEAVYIGNMHATLSLGHAMLFNSRMATNAIPVIRDQSLQDVPLAETHVAALKGRIRVATLPLGIWRAGVHTNKHFDPILLPTPRQ